jgi:hypothetical protein
LTFFAFGFKYYASIAFRFFCKLSILPFFSIGCGARSPKTYDRLFCRAAIGARGDKRALNKIRALIEE